MVSKDTILSPVLRSSYKIAYSRIKVDPYLALVQETEAEKRHLSKIRIQTEFNKISLNSFFLVVIVILSFFRVEFCPLYRNSEEAFRSRRIRLIRMGTTIPNRHIYSVRTGAIILNRRICLPSWIVSKQTHQFNQNRRNRSE